MLLVSTESLLTSGDGRKQGLVAVVGHRQLYNMQIVLMIMVLCCSCVIALLMHPVQLISMGKEREASISRTEVPSYHKLRIYASHQLEDAM